MQQFIYFFFFPKEKNVFNGLIGKCNQKADEKYKLLEVCLDKQKKKQITINRLDKHTKKKWMIYILIYKNVCKVYYILSYNNAR